MVFKNSSTKASLIIMLIMVVSCSSNDSTVDKPSSVIGQFNTALTSAASQIQSSSLSGSLTKGISSKNLITSVDDVCDENGQPIDEGDFMDQNDPEFPARTFYCKMVKNTDSPESIQGAYSLIQSVSCALENAGVVFDGVSHSATVSVNSDCFSAESLEDDEMPGTIEVTYTASQPAAFNPNFQAGVEMEIDGFGTFTIAASVNGSSIEFLGYENQGTNKTGAYIGQFNSETGEIRFESRHDRFRHPEEDDGGWAKHDRIYLKCGSVSSSGKCEDVQTVHAASSDIFSESDSGRIVTMSGDFSEGVKTRFYQITGSNEFNDPDAWTENTAGASRCYLLDSPTAGDCSSNDGIELPSSTFVFTMFDGYMENEAWHEEAGNLDFTSVSLADDLP